MSFLELTVEPKFHSRLCGLCGNFNGDKADDFFGRRGRMYRDGQSFGDNWRVGGLRACSVLPQDMPRSYEPQCTQTWESRSVCIVLRRQNCPSFQTICILCRIKSDRSCNALNSPLFDSCSRDKVDSTYYFNACKLDMCECPGDQCHCEVLTAYARECERKGVLVHDWRRDTGCENVTSFSFSEAMAARNEVIMDSSKNQSGAAAATSNSPLDSKPVWKFSSPPSAPPPENGPFRDGGDGAVSKEKKKKKAEVFNDDALGEFQAGE